MTLKQETTPVFSLDNFTGPLRFLLQLIQKSEIDIRDIPLQKITTQYLERLEKELEKEMESGAEFIDTAATLLWVKSRMLMPQGAALGLEEDETEGERLLIERIVDYYQCKCLGKHLSEKENEGFFLRKPPTIVAREPDALENITLEGLAELFSDLMSRVQTPEPLISDDEGCSLEEQVEWLRQLMRKEGKATMSSVISQQKTRERIIVTFLGILELMKIGEIRIVRISSEVSLISRVHEARNQPIF